jgi:hypothetical protein
VDKLDSDLLAALERVKPESYGENIMRAAAFLIKAVEQIENAGSDVRFLAEDTNADVISLGKKIDDLNEKLDNFVKVLSSVLEALERDERTETTTNPV